jgi:hypothetical protein
MVLQRFSHLGVDFKRAAVVRTPASNVDITPTLCWR